TGLPQSAVSTAVARLREAGAVVAEPDPADRRRVRIQPNVSDRVDQVRAATIDTALAKALGDADRVAEVAALLDRLAEHLTPQVLSRLRD
ncbi:MAG: MarR family transcriptional regulator, partial [Saccharothrix sp.]|nr:MarR family transcriptional regulator [Saccharothrix sp.]